jgi:transposase
LVYWNFSFQAGHQSILLGRIPFQGESAGPQFGPPDKFRPDNLSKAFKFLSVIVQMDPRRVKFGDEKLLKGQEIYSRGVRRDPITGNVPFVATDSDFRNTYAIVGFCGIDYRTKPLHYRIHEDKNNAFEFAVEAEEALLVGFLKPGDVLVLDNAAIHNAAENRELLDWLWSRFGIFLLFLPARTLERNPIELVWRKLVQGLKKIPLNVVRQFGCHLTAMAAHHVLSGIFHRNVEALYKCCDLFSNRVA